MHCYCSGLVSFDRYYGAEQMTAIPGHMTLIVVGCGKKSATNKRSDCIQYLKVTLSSYVVRQLYICCMEYVCVSILSGGKRPVAYRTEVRVNNEISDIALYVFSTLCAVGSIVAILFLAITLRYKHVRSVSLQT